MEFAEVHHFIAQLLSFSELKQFIMITLFFCKRSLILSKSHCNKDYSFCFVFKKTNFNTKPILVST